MKQLIVLEMIYGIALCLFCGVVLLRKKYGLLHISAKKGKVPKHAKLYAWILFVGGSFISVLSIVSFWIKEMVELTFILLLLTLAFLVYVATRKGNVVDRYIELKRVEIDRLDRKMRRLFVKRMNVVSGIGEYKRKMDLPIHDFKREEEIYEKQEKKVPKRYRTYFHTFLATEFALSGALQKSIKQGRLGGDSLHVSLPGGGYDILIRKGAIEKVERFFRLSHRQVLIVTDDGIPDQYVQTVKDRCENAIVVTLPAGESSKNFENMQMLWKTMQDHLFDRRDCVIAIGGGMVGDVSGFVAGSYLRGIDFYNIPTTLLAMVDSSIGGKCGINMGGYKNQIGLFYQPKCVLIDPDLLATLPRRQLANGFAEILKVAALGDAELFRIFEQAEEGNHLEEVITRAIRFKVSIVEKDEREEGMRRALNYGHTIGHALEMTEPTLYHGECVALGMLAESSGEVRLKLTSIYRRIGLPTTWDGDVDLLFDAVVHDKKRVGHHISYVFVPKIGKYVTKEKSVEDWKKSALQHGREVFKTSYEK